MDSRLRSVQYKISINISSKSRVEFQGARDLDRLAFKIVSHFGGLDLAGIRCNNIINNNITNKKFISLFPNKPLSKQTYSTNLNTS